MLRKNKKAWLRIVEAFIAIMLILSTLLVLLSRQGSNSEVEKEINLLQSNILNSIGKDDYLREQILADDSSGVKAYVGNVTPSWINYSVKICQPLDVCPINVAPELLDGKSIYSQNILITASITNADSKQLKLFFWKN
ncbi:hypothetical protein FJZ17_04620 [Candidatus Pacearchaeota archaeon]|nr:hypothetical protein [Candidatus Pacearchaeota archaeon]